MCVKYNSFDTGVYARNDNGQLEAFEATSYQSMDIVVSTNLSLLFNALATMFIFRLLYYHHALEFWSDWKMWVVGSAVFIPIIVNIVECEKVFYASVEIECPIDSTPDQFKEQNAKMESLLSE